MRVFLILYWCSCYTFCFTQTLQNADILYEEEEYDEARLAYLVVLDNNKNLSDSLTSIVYHKLGVCQYYLFQDQMAIVSWDSSLVIRQRILPENHIQVIKNYRNLANAYLNLGNYNDAKERFEKALLINLSRKIPDTILLVDIYQELGYILTQQNNLVDAEAYLKLSLNLSQEVYNDKPWEIADSYNLLVSLYSEYNQPRKMIEYARNGISIYQNLDKKYEEDHISLAYFYNNLGVAFELIDDLKKAIEYYEKALTINQKFKKSRYSALSDNHNNLSAIFNKKHNFKKALYHIESAIVIDMNYQNFLGLVTNYNTKGDIHLAQKDYIEAFKSYQEGITYLVSNYNPKSVHDLPPIQNSIIANKPYLIEDLFDKAKAYQAYAQETNPIENLQYGLQTIDSISVLINLVRTSFESDASKAFQNTQAKTIFEKAIELCFELAQLTGETTTYYAKALDYAERSKSIILLDAVKQSGAKIMAGIPPYLLDREQQLKKSIADIEETIFSETEETTLTSLRINLSQQQQALAALVDTFETQYPTYFQLKYDFEPIDLKTIQQGLDTETAIVEYFIGKEKAYWFYVDGQQIKMDTIGKVQQLAPTIKAFRESIFAPFTQSNTAQDSAEIQYAQLGQILYQQLLAPALSTIAKQSLRIIPDGILGYLPFDALLTDSLHTTLGNYKAYPFLQRTHRLCYSYSLALLVEKQQQQNQTVQKEILGIAPIFQAKSPLQLGKTTIQLAPLLANVTTTENLLAKYQGTALLNEAAQKAQFLQAAPDYAYLHLASHAQMNDENGDYSFVSFSQTTDTVQQDNLLFVRELYNVPLKAEMVVLSACETALGELQEGEGIISLARAFAYAGAKSIITTLWQVSDQRSAELVTAFYDSLALGNTKDEALWQAKNSLIEQGFNAHPYNWAGFIPIGDMGAVKLTKRTEWIWWVLVGMGLLGLLIGIRFLMLRNSV